MHADVIIVVASFRAEGTPRMALDLCRLWMSWGLRVAILDLQHGSDDMRSAFERLSVPIVTCRLGHKGYLRYFGLVWHAWRICRSLRPMSVLSMPSGLHAFIFIGAKLAGTKRTVVHQGVYPFHWKTGFWKYRLEYRIGDAFTDRVVACSRYVKSGVVKCFPVNSDKVVAIYNGVRLESFHRDRTVEGRAANQKPVVLMVGRIDATKDFQTLIDAAEILARRKCAVEFRLAGDGDQREELERDVIDRGLSERIRFLGVRDDIPEQLGCADIFVYSVHAEEGLGIALIEAMAAGVPAVASDVPACREVLEDGRLGTLVPAADPEALADAIEVMLAKPDIVRQRAQAAQTVVLKKFSAETMARRYADVLGLPVDPGPQSAPSTGSPAKAGIVSAAWP